jgi:coenzyme F420 hydrogenase subunit beta
MQLLELSRFAGMQPHHQQRKSVLIARLLGLWLCRQPVPRFAGLRLVAAARHGGRHLLANLTGMIRRVKRGANRETIPGWTPRP